MSINVTRAEAMHQVSFLSNKTFESIHNESYHYNETSNLITSPEVDTLYGPLTYIYIWSGIANVILFLFGVIGNTLVIALVCRMRDMRTATNFFLANLGFADLFVMLICQPTALIEFYARDRWLLGAFMCKLVPFLENSVVHASVLTILAITTERFNAICNPLKRNLTCSKASALKVIALIWIVAFLTALPFTFMTAQEDAIFQDGSPCTVCRTRVIETWNHVYVLAIFVIFLCCPMFMLVAIYSKIIRQLMVDSSSLLQKRVSCAKYSLKTRRQVVRMLIGIVFLFFISMLPVRILGLWLIYAPPEQIMKLGLAGYLNILCLARIMIYLNSAGNPIIYTLTSSKFRHAFQRMFGKCETSRRRSLYRCTMNSNNTSRCRRYLSSDMENQTFT